PFRPTEFTYALDAAWADFLHDAFAQGRQFGEDVVFTYGPYGFVATGAFHAETWPALLAAQVALALAAALALERLIDRFPPHPVVALGWLLLLAWLGPDPMLLTVALAAVLAVARGDGPAGPQELLIAASLALVGLIKFNYLVAAVGVVGVL